MKERIKKPKYWLIAVSAVVLLTPVVLYFILPGWQNWINEAWAVLTSKNEARIEAWVNDLGWYAPAAIVALMTIQMFLFVIPSWLLMVISVMAYGAFAGGALAVFAVAVASAIGYGIGKAAGEPAMKKVLGEKKDAWIRKETDRYGFWAIIITRLNPLLSNDAISVLGGALRMGFWKFLMATLAGIIPLVIIIGLLGHNAESMKTSLFWLSGVSLLGLGFKIWWDKRQDRHEAEASDKTAQAPVGD